MAIGRQSGVVRAIQVAPRSGPQSFTVRMLLGDVLSWTRGERAAELSVIPKRTHTYFAPYKPGSAQRIPPVINTGVGSDYVNGQRVRTALVARALMLRDGLLSRRGPSGASGASGANGGQTDGGGAPGSGSGFGLGGSGFDPTVYHPEDYA